MNLLKGSWFLKILALIAAILTYVYIHDEMYKVETKTPDPSYKLLKLTAKTLPVKVRLGTRPPDGYRILENQVSVIPERAVVVGPEALLDEVSNAETALIDVSENTKTIIRKIPLESIAGTPLTGEPYLVEVTVPIEKIESGEPKKSTEGQ